jgi:hypothetical protein
MPVAAGKHRWLLGGDGRSGNASYGYSSSLVSPRSLSHCPHLPAIVLGYKIISPFLAVGAWLFGAFAVLVWFWPWVPTCLSKPPKSTIGPPIHE